MMMMMMVVVVMMVMMMMRDEDDGEDVMLRYQSHTCTDVLRYSHTDIHI